jgi:alkylation response protein AidB-like acyl-CoA dehydrogenase
MSLLVPEQYEGFGGGFLDLAVLLTEMGYFCLPGPFFSTVVLGGLTVLEAGNEDQKAQILPEIASGKRLMTLAWLEEQGLYTPEGITLTATSQGNDHILTGTKLFVPDAHVADTIICVGRTAEAGKDGIAGLTLFLVDAGSPGLQVEILRTTAGDKQCEVTFDHTTVHKENILGQPGEAWPLLKRILQMSAVAKCAEMTGGARRVMELAVPYTKERVQFGRPVGSFQAVQHHCANMLSYQDTIEFITYEAAWRISAGLPFDKEASMCKAWVSDSYRKLVGLGHQVIGGTAFMEEHDLQLYFKRAKAAELAYGDPEFHREMVAQAMEL